MSYLVTKKSVQDFFQNHSSGVVTLNELKSLFDVREKVGKYSRLMKILFELEDEKVIKKGKAKSALSSTPGFDQSVLMGYKLVRE